MPISYLFVIDSYIGSCAAVTRWDYFEQQDLSQNVVSRLESKLNLWIYLAYCRPTQYSCLKTNTTC